MPRRRDEPKFANGVAWATVVSSKLETFAVEAQRGAVRGMVSVVEPS
jgi:hypothetical protein